MRKVILFFLLFAVSFTYGQYRVTFVIDSLPAATGGNIFLAGNFNMWNPGDTNFVFVNVNGKNTLVTSLEPGNYEYKLTRGSWHTVEEQADLKPLSNRTLTLSSDTTIHLVIAAWAKPEAQPDQPASRTATPQVHILDTAFRIPELERTRRIWIYLPKGYETSGRKYPVLYMQDGQNIFDASTAFSGEWGVDEFLDSLQSGCRQAIVVAVDNGGEKRMTEYNPWAFRNFGKGEGDLYTDFLVKSLKPYIDEHFRTLRDKQHTSIAGSSMGGLISLYAVLKYPDVFGSAGIFSPAFWTASGIDTTVAANIGRVRSKLFFYAGGKEGDTMLPDMYRIEKEVKDRSESAIKQVVDPGAKHNEAAWRKHFPEFYHWVFCGK